MAIGASSASIMFFIAVAIVTFASGTKDLVKAKDAMETNEEMVMLQQEVVNVVDGVVHQTPPEVPSDEKPYTIPLRREAIPVKRNGKVVSFKATYSGSISVGTPAQQFNVVFDTGSGHVVLPAKECKSQVCKAHRQYAGALSRTGQAINIDKSAVQKGELIDQVTVGYGTGKITGSFVHEHICLGTDNLTQQDGLPRPCADLAFINAVEMSQNPFGLFPFDGICGLGLSGLALDPEFSFFNVLSKGLGVPQFAFYLSDGENGVQSELAFGGHNPAHLASPLKWTPVPMSDKGYWQVNIVAVYIGDEMLDICSDGTCRGVIDTGTSHLGVPAPHDSLVEKKLTTRAGDLMDCRLADTPDIKIELPGFNLTLGAENYMRRLPIRNDISLEQTGVKASSNASQSANTTNSSGKEEVFTSNLMTTVPDDGTTKPGEVVRYCRPRMMPVKLPPPLGPKLFLLGEPVLHRYYTVFDWATPAIGFGESANKHELVTGEHGNGYLPKDVDVYLMQQKLSKTNENGEVEEVNFVQMTIVCREPRVKMA